MLQWCQKKSLNTHILYTIKLQYIQFILAIWKQNYKEFLEKTEEWKIRREELISGTFSNKEKINIYEEGRVSYIGEEAYF